MLARIGSHIFGGGWFWEWFWHDLSIRQSSIINQQFVIHQLSVIIHQSSIIYHHPSISHRSSIIDHQSSTIEHLRGSRKVEKMKNRKHSETFGNHWKALETLGNPSETLGNSQKPLETFGNLREASKNGCKNELVGRNGSG